VELPQEVQPKVELPQEGQHMPTLPQEVQFVVKLPQEEQPKVKLPQEEQQEQPMVKLPLEEQHVMELPQEEQPIGELFSADEVRWHWQGQRPQSWSPLLKEVLLEIKLPLKWEQPQKMGERGSSIYPPLSLTLGRKLPSEEKIFQETVEDSTDECT
jgi:hypothetical protein